MSLTVVHVTTIRFFEFHISNLLTSKIHYFQFCYLEFLRKVVIFSLKTILTIFQKLDDFSWKKSHKNKEWISTNFICITIAQYCISGGDHVHWKMVTDSWYIRHCVNKSKLLQYMPWMVRETSKIGIWTCLLQQIRLEHFEIISVYFKSCGSC